MNTKHPGGHRLTAKTLNILYVPRCQTFYIQASSHSTQTLQIRKPRNPSDSATCAEHTMASSSNMSPADLDWSHMPPETQPSTDLFDNGFSFDGQQNTTGEIGSNGIADLDMDFDATLDPSLLEPDAANVPGNNFNYPDPEVATANIFQKSSIQPRTSQAPSPYQPLPSNFDFTQTSGYTSMPSVQRAPRTPIRPYQPPRYVPLGCKPNLTPGGMWPVQRPMNPRPNVIYPPPPGFVWSSQNPNVSSRPWSPNSVADMVTQQNSRRLTSPSQMISSLDSALWMHGGTQSSKPSSKPRKYKPITRLIDEEESGPEDLALSAEDLRSGSRKRKHTRNPSPLATSRSGNRATDDVNGFCKSFDQLMSPTRSQRPMRAVRKRNLSSIPEADNAASPADDHDMDGCNVPPNTLNLGPRNSGSKEEMMRKAEKARHTYFNDRDDAASPAQEENPPRFVSELDITTARPRASRRYRHPGRKTFKEQTPETILKNALRRERYRASLTRAQRKLYDREAPE